MRVLLKASGDTQKANEAIRGGRMAEILKQTMERLQPEAAYFGPMDGRRTMLLVFDLPDPSQLPPLTDALFQELNATVEITPVMNLEDLQKGLAQEG
ncbi:hypothetical protein ACYF6T_23225 [Streptomyces sp. 7R007]